MTQRGIAEVSTGYGSPAGGDSGPWQPLLAGVTPEHIIAWRNGRAVRVGEFLADVSALAARLPNAGAAVNLCEDRYAFTVAFAALLTRGQTNLLPPSRAANAVDAVLAAHPGSYTLGDAGLDPAPPNYFRITPGGHASRSGPLAPIAPDAIAAIGYTSGSTGVPAANPKRWDRFGVSTRNNGALLRGLAGADFHIVATVPPQHMYGLEFSVLLPLFGLASASAARPFFAADVAAALRELPQPRVLVTTPVHLRALVDARQEMPACAAIVSATAPLSAALARMAEAHLRAPVQEMFGATETCVIAHRRSAHEVAWTPFPGVALQPQPDGTRVDALQVGHPVVLADLIELDDDGRFRLCGRNTDLLEIAGKRASLGDLTRKLLAVPGVRDAVVFQAGTERIGVRRVAALVVAPGLTAAAITAALRRAIDPVFLPRPLKLVAALPRNETGKMPHSALLGMLQRDSGSAAGNP